MLGTPNSMALDQEVITEVINNRYGFEKMFTQMCMVGEMLDGDEGSGGERFFRIIVKRLESTGDLELVAQR